MIAYDRNIPETEMVLQYRCYECSCVGFVKYSKPIEYEEDFKLAIPDGWERVKIRGTKHMEWKDGTEDKMVYVCDKCTLAVKKKWRKTEDRIAFKHAIEDLEYNSDMYEDYDIVDLACMIKDLNRIMREEAERRGLLDNLIRNGIIDKEE